MRSDHDVDTEVAEALSQYIDALASGQSLDQEKFLVGFPDIADELRPLLVAAFATRRALRGAKSDVSKQERAAVTDFRTAATRIGVERGTVAVPVDKRPDILLLLLDQVGELWGKTRLQKLLLLVARETTVPSIVPEFYQHYAYNYGPYDHLVQHDVTQLCDAGVMQVKAPGVSSRKDRSVDAVFSLTPRGEKFAGALARSPEGAKVLAQLRPLVAKYARMPLLDLVRYVYSTYPETTVKSKIRDVVLGKDTDDER